MVTILVKIGRAAQPAQREIMVQYPKPLEEWTGVDVHEFALAMLGVLDLERELAILSLWALGGRATITVRERFRDDTPWCWTPELPLRAAVIDDAVALMPEGGYFLGENVPGERCGRCEGQSWVCEAHPHRPLSHAGCDAPGEPCPVCNWADLPRPPG